MVASTEERNRILEMVEAGKVTAAQAAQLLDMLALEQPQQVERTSQRMIRIRVTNVTNRRQKANVVLPVSLIHVGLRLATRLAPQVSGSALEDLLRAIASGKAGRLLDLQDLEEGERVEIYTE